MIEGYFRETFNIPESVKLTDNITLWVNASQALTKSYGLTEEQQQLIDLLYVGCQLSSAPLYIIPPSAALTSESVRDFSVGYAPLLAQAESAGFCGQYRELLSAFGFRNKKTPPIILRR